MEMRHFRHVGLRTPRLDEAVAFYTDVWGLRLVEANGSSAYLRGLGGEHHVLELHRAERKGLDHLAFAVGTPADVEAAATELGDAGLAVVSDPAPLDRPGGGYGMRLTDHEGRIVELSAGVERLTPVEPDERVRPRKVSHVVLNTADIDASVDFYTSRLAMRVSDWSEHFMAFLRCDTEHHNLAFTQNRWASLNHIAYDVGDIDTVMRGIGQMKRHGQVPVWGPGKHGPGGNVFAYFQDPSGLVCEYTCGMETVDEDTWVPRVWERTPELIDLWGTSGPPSPEARAAMAGEPDPGPLATPTGKR